MLFNENRDNNIDINYINNEEYSNSFNQNINLDGYNMNSYSECPRENVCHRQIHHEVKHIVPIHTKIVNHHIIHHKYEPSYSCSCVEECCNVYEPICF